MEWIKRIVNDLIKTYDTRDVYELTEHLNIVLIKKDLPHSVKGRFFRDIFGSKYFFISNALTPQEKRVVIAHELGHAILHTKITAIFYYTEHHLLIKNKIERQANKFAAELLIPDNPDNPDIDDSVLFNYLTINQISSYLGLPEELVKLKFNKE